MPSLNCIKQQNILPESNTVIKLQDILEDLRAWFGKGGKGGVGGGGWDRYNSSGDRVGKCGDAKEGDAYSACLSKEKARKLGKAGRAAFVKRKRAAQGKGGDAKKGGERKKGQKPIKVKTGVNESDQNGLHLKKLGNNEYVVYATKGGREVGKLNFIKSKFKPVLKATIVTVDPAHRRQGIGSSMYIYAEKELGMKFVKSDEVLTPDGKAIWNTPNRKFGIQEIDYHSKISRGHKPDWYRLHTTKFVPFDENFADGKNPGRKGLSKRFGISQKMTIAQLQKIAKTATGERRRMAQWNLNMKRGRMKQENLDPKTYKDTGKSSPYGSGYQKVKDLEERLNLFLEKNIPTKPDKWAYAKSQAKKKFDVYPSAYANAWAAKKYKSLGGGWRKG